MRGHGFQTQRSHNIWCQKFRLVHTLKHGGRRWYNIVDSKADGVRLPDLEIGWEATCDVLSIRIPGSQEKEEECSVCWMPKSNVQTFGLVVECWTDVWEVIPLLTPIKWIYLDRNQLRSSSKRPYGILAKHQLTFWGNFTQAHNSCRRWNVDLAICVIYFQWKSCISDRRNVCNVLSAGFMLRRSLSVCVWYFQSGNMDAQISAAFSRLQTLCVRLAREHTRHNVTTVMRELESIECTEVMQQLQEYVLFPLRLILKQPEQRYIVYTSFFTV